LVARERTTCLVQTLDPGAKESRLLCWGKSAPREGGIEQEALLPVEHTGLAGLREVAVSGMPKGCAITSAGKVACWDFDMVREMDDLDGAVSVGLNGLSNVACAVRRSGSVVCSSVDYDDHVSTVVASGIKDAVAISSNEDYVCALLRSGNVACWEDAYTASLGQGGDDEEDPRTKPIQPVMVQGLRGAVQVATSGARSCAVTGEGGVACWGGRMFDELYDTSVGPFAAVPVQGVAGAVEVAAGMFHACAVLKSGAVTCWGTNTEGQLGSNVSVSSDVPVQVQGIDDAIHVTAGDEHTCVQRRSGAVFCWGSAHNGTLGNGTALLHASPVEVAGIEDAVRVVAGPQRTCAFRKGGQVDCWGKGYLNFLSQDRRGIPPSQLPGAAGAVSLSLGTRLECAVTKAGEVVCVEASTSGGAPPSAVVPDLRAARAVALEGTLGVALLGTGKAVLWGGGWSPSGVARNEKLRATLKSASPNDAAPVLEEAKVRTLPIPGLADAVEVAIERSTVCFRRRSGKIACARHVGSGTFNEGFSQGPGKLTEVPDVRDAVNIAAGVGQFCAVRKSGAVLCFNADGFPLPDGVKGAQKPLTVQPMAGVEGAVSVAMGGSFTCALLSSGKVACKGDNYLGMLGVGDFERHSQVVLVKGMEDAVSISAGGRHVCVARKTGRVACWGSNEGDAAGHPDPATTNVPVEVKGVLR
ncbi:MAG: hypothetical protein R3B70_48835, partial [Polyangiaceae bacterium]